MDNQIQFFKDAQDVEWINTTGSDVSKNELVELGADPDSFCGVTQEDIASGAKGLVRVQGRFAFAIASGSGGAIGTPYYRSTATLLTTTGTSVTCFAGWGASSIMSTDASGTKVRIDLSRARPNWES